MQNSSIQSKSLRCQRKTGDSPTGSPSSSSLVRAGKTESFGLALILTDQLSGVFAY